MQPEKSSSNGDRDDLSQKGTPNLIFRILQLTLHRVRESRETRAYALAIIVSNIIGIILEAFIAVAHANATRDVYASLGDGGGIRSPFSGATADDMYTYILLSLQRLKDENVFFVLFHVFQLYLGFDAIVRQSIIQLIAHTCNQFISVILALVQLGETLKWSGAVSSADKQTGESTPRSEFFTALRYEIGLIASMAVLALLFVYLCVKLVRQFGWNIYKRLGADPGLQSRFRTCQVFLLILKLDGFFQLVFSIFWLVVMTQEGYHKGTPAAIAWYVLHLLLTVLQFPAPFIARHALLTEKPRPMMLFMVIHILVVVDFIVVLQQSSTSWVFWVLAVCLAILLSLITIILSIIVTRNFDKGLKPYVQRLFDKNYRYRFNASANPTIMKPNENNARQSWVIDDIDDDDEDPNATPLTQQQNDPESANHGRR
ncbi:hypothetical protein VTP01DRAFT_1488 [Rhizomucor pusillus]|uniref:uncharacterized protein n=1 Tax=Rhizomucor pusillus TaxID=4840 RepID=UPI0037439638